MFVTFTHSEVAIHALSVCLLLQLVSSIQNLTGLVTSSLWFQNSIDQAVS